MPWLVALATLCGLAVLTFIATYPWGRVLRQAKRWARKHGVRV